MIEAVARTGGLRRPARAHGVSPPAGSTQLAAFEQRYRVRLFARDGNTFNVSAVGEQLLPKIRTLLAIAGEIERDMLAERVLDAGRLVLGYSVDQFVMPVLSRFMARHPNVRIEARAMASQDLLALLREGRIEAAFVTMHAPDADLFAHEIRRERIVMMVPRGHPLAGRGPLGWDALSGLPLVRREAASGTRRIFDAAAEAAGASLRPVLELGSWTSLRAAVVAGIGVGFALAGEIGDDEDLAPVPIDDPALEVGHYLVTLGTLRMLATVTALLDACIDPDDAGRAASEDGASPAPAGASAR